MSLPDIINNLSTGEMKIPLIALRDVVLFPLTEIPLTFGRVKSNAAISAAFKVNKLICFVCQKNSRTEIPGEEDLYRIGTLASIEHIIESDGNIHALVRGLSRVKIGKILQTEPYFVASVVGDKETIVEDDALKALAKHTTEQIQKIFNLGKPIDVILPDS